MIRLRLTRRLGRSLEFTNPWKSMIDWVRTTQRKVKHRGPARMRLRWQGWAPLIQRNAAEPIVDCFAHGSPAWTAGGVVRRVLCGRAANCADHAPWRPAYDAKSVHPLRIIDVGLHDRNVDPRGGGAFPAWGARRLCGDGRCARPGWSHCARDALADETHQ
jgi:hypothetical protein